MAARRPSPVEVCRRLSCRAASPRVHARAIRRGRAPQSAAVHPAHQAECTELGRPWPLRRARTVIRRACRPLPPAGAGRPAPIRLARLRCPVRPDCSYLQGDGRRDGTRPAAGLVGLSAPLRIRHHASTARCCFHAKALLRLGFARVPLLPQRSSTEIQRRDCCFRPKGECGVTALPDLKDNAARLALVRLAEVVAGGELRDVFDDARVFPSGIRADYRRPGRRGRTGRAPIEPIPDSRTSGTLCSFSTFPLVPADADAGPSSRLREPHVGDSERAYFWLARADSRVAVERNARQ